MNAPNFLNSENETKDLVFQSNLYKEYCLKRDEILKYKWIESEKIGRDIGLDKAWLQWEAKYYQKWKHSISNTPPDSQDKKPNESGNGYSSSPSK